jgi:hypothetical protein
VVRKQFPELAYKAIQGLFQALKDNDVNEQKLAKNKFEREQAKK